LILEGYGKLEVGYDDYMTYGEGDIYTRKWSEWIPK
jgi:hypothetical protein